MKLHSKFLITMGLVFAWALTVQAQTNQPPTFQGFPVGAVVQVHVDRPLILLNRAILREINVSNLVVESKGERLVINKAGAELTAVAPTALEVSAQRAVGPPSQPEIKPAAGSDLDNLQAEVQQLVLGKYSSDPGYGKATARYQSMMADYKNGKLSLADITAQAEQVLKEVDRYQPERQKDPQFESQIATLRDFVKRAKAGEKVETAPVE